MVAVRIPRTPTEIERRRFRLRVLAALGLVVFLAAVWLFWRIVPDVPERGFLSDRQRVQVAVRPDDA